MVVVTKCSYCIIIKIHDETSALSYFWSVTENPRVAFDETMQKEVSERGAEILTDSVMSKHKGMSILI
jgi:hypothetical protein